MIIPALDLLKGHVVRLKQGDYSRTTDFDVDPIKKILDAANQGAELIHIVDLEGARDPSCRQHALISEIVKSSPLPIQTGGGIRSEFDIKNLLAIGVERVVIGSAAVQSPELVRGWMRRFGGERFVLALDVNIENGIPYVATHGWLKNSGLRLETVLDGYLNYGIEHVLITDISRDGMLQGANNSLYASVARKYRDLDIIASGGISSLDDIKNVAYAGATSCVLGRALLEGRFSVEEAIACWPNA